MVQVRQGKLNFTAMSDIPEEASVLTGTFSINDTPIKILFDSGATHSFISEKLLGKMGLKGSHTTSAYKIITPGGQITTNILIRGVCLGLGSKIFPTNLIVISLVGMDVILGMDSMTQHKVILDISDRVRRDQFSYGRAHYLVPTFQGRYRLLCLCDHYLPS
jgi:hypothetical protein